MAKRFWNQQARLNFRVIIFLFQELKGFYQHILALTPSTKASSLTHWPVNLTHLLTIQWEIFVNSLLQPESAMPHTPHMSIPISTERCREEDDLRSASLHLVFLTWTFNKPNICGSLPYRAILWNEIILLGAAENCGKESKLVWKLQSRPTTPLTVMYEIYCLNISAWSHKVGPFTSPKKTPLCQLHSTGSVTEVAWYQTHVSYSVVNGVRSELCHSLAGKHTDCPHCVHNKCKTILHMVLVWHLELMEKI